MGRALVPDGCPLTPTQFAIIVALCEGKTYKQIAAARTCTMSAVRGHVSEARKKLGVADTKQVMAAMGRSGWLGWAPAPDVDSPLANTHPFLSAYLSELEHFRWPAQARPDERTRRGLELALAGARNAVR